MTGHRIWQAGAFVRTVTDKTECMRIIKDTSRFAPDPQYVFTANITGHIPEHRLNDVINFPPIIRNVDIVTNRGTIGDFLHNYMTKNKMKVEQKERKLTNLVKVNKSTMFSCSGMCPVIFAVNTYCGSGANLEVSLIILIHSVLSVTVLTNAPACHI